MKRMTQLAGTILVAAALTACGGNTTADDRAERTGDNAEATASATADRAEDATERADRDAADANRGDRVADRDAVGTAGTGDNGFIADQLEDGQAEIELGKLAQQRASNARVKEFAAMMVKDHTKAGAELRQIGSVAGNAAPKAEEKNRDHKNLREDLAKLRGAEFDKQYMDAMVKEHQEAVDELKDQAENAKNAELKRWAAKTLPVVQQHLEHAQQLQQSLERNQR